MSRPERPGGPASGELAQVHLVGVGPGPVDLLTVRASRLIAMSGTCLYAHDLVPREAMSLVPPTARVVDGSGLSDTRALDEIRTALERGDRVACLFAGTPDQHDEASQLTEALDTAGVSWEVVPGVPHPGFPTPLEASRAYAAGDHTRAARPAGGAAASGLPVGGPGLILVLGGTGEARDLAELLVTAGLEVVTALAGKVARPRLPRGEVRIGEFGGAEGLAHWLRESSVSAVIDATDPFAEQISVDALHAAAATAVPLLRLERPEWSESGGDEWIHVPDVQGAVAVVRERFRRPMLTVGKLGASAFADDARGSYLIRCSEPPPGPLPDRYLLVLDRGPFGVESERTLMSRHRIDVLVTRNSGGRASAAKLEAARALRIPVVMVDRPRSPTTTADAPPAPETVHRIEDAARWLVERFGSR